MSTWDSSTKTANFRTSELPPASRSAYGLLTWGISQIFCDLRSMLSSTTGTWPNGTPLFGRVQVICSATSVTASTLQISTIHTTRQMICYLGVQVWSRNFSRLRMAIVCALVNVRKIIMEWNGTISLEESQQAPPTLKSGLDSALGFLLWSLLRNVGSSPRLSKKPTGRSSSN